MKLASRMIGLGILIFNSLCIVPVQADCVTPPAGLTGWWQGEGNGIDSVGGNNMAPADISFVAGEVGQAFGLNGTNQWVNCGNTTTGNFGTNDFTIEFWVKFNSLDNRQIMVEKYVETYDLSGPPAGWTIVKLSNNSFQFAGVNSSVVYGAAVAGTWTHMAVTRNHGQIQCYVNGVLSGQLATPPGNLDSTASLKLGHRGNPTDTPGSLDTNQMYLNGALDEVSTYNRALSATEIQSIYNAGSAGKCDDGMFVGMLINVDFSSFGAQASAVSLKSGLAAMGKTTNDFWNAYSRDDGLGGYLTFGTLSNLATSDGAVSAVGLTVSDAPGDWGNGSSDPMYGSFIYAFDGGNPVITLTNLPAGLYDLYLYSNDGNLDVTVGSTDYGAKTALDSPLVNPPVWQEGKQYVRFQNLAVGAGQAVSVSVEPGTSYPGFISGLQILAEVPTTPAILTQPASQTVAAGNTASFSVTTTALPIGYQWTYNQTNIPGATNATLTLTNLHANQSGNYQVTIYNAYGTNTSSIATLTVLVQRLLAYNYSGSETVITTGLEATYKFSGQMIFIPASTNGTFIGWGTLSGKKQYWISPFSSNLLLFTIPGRTNHVYTVFGEAGQAIDTNGYPNLWFNLHTGLNKSLLIGNKLTFSFPDMFACDESHVYPDAKTSNMILTEASSIYTFSPTATQTANNNGQTMIDLVNAQIKSLVKQGYQVQ